jgi:hypothetical protein
MGGGKQHLFKGTGLYGCKDSFKIIMMPYPHEVEPCESLCPGNGTLQDKNKIWGANFEKNITENCHAIARGVGPHLFSSMKEIWHSDMEEALYGGNSSSAVPPLSLYMETVYWARK